MKIYLIYFRTPFHIPGSNPSLVIAIKRSPNYKCHVIDHFTFCKRTVHASNKSLMFYGELLRHERTQYNKWR